MKKEGFRESIRTIIRNNQINIEDRIDRVFQILDDRPDTHKKNEEDKEVVAYSELIEMIKEENKNHEFDLQYLQLLTLLAEKYVKLKEYQKLRNVALDTLELLREESTPYDCLEYTIPRIASAVEYSVYNHYLFEILLRFIKEALKNDKLDEEIKYEIKQVLKLNLLLKDNTIPSGVLDKKLTDAITKLFTAEELMNIILNPSLNTLKVDPVEYTWEWEYIYYSLEDELDALLAHVPKGMGFCFHYWSAKEDLLRKKYNIQWKSPSVMNPNVIFD